MKENKSLYNIDKTIKEVLENGFVINEETGEVIFETSDLEKLEMDRDNKINNIIGFIKSLDIEAKALLEIANDYKKRVDSKKKKIENLKKYLDIYLQANNMTDKKEYMNGITSYRKSESLEILPNKETDLNIYLLGNKDLEKCISTEYSINKTELKKEIKSGKEIPFVNIVEKQNLQIK